MQIITTINEMRNYSHEARLKDKTIGFVPTMGYLHEGHLSLIRAARKECDIVIVSIFVNPTQFAPGEDLEKYPRDMEKDKRLAEAEGTDVIFAPSVEEMYLEGHDTYIEISGNLTENLCGSSRPGHFRGVATVVAKLFNIVQPHKAYFGQKDAQQVVIIKSMVKDLGMPVEVHTMPIVREKDGLAMSSRNTYLSEAQRQQALRLFRCLEQAKEMAVAGELSTERIKNQLRSVLQSGKDIRIDYIEIVDADNLKSLETVTGNTLVAVAVLVGSTRLIDNIVIKKG